MARAKKLDLKNYLNLVKLFYLIPENYLPQSAAVFRLKHMLFFSLINLFLGLLVNTVTYIYIYQSLQVVFISLTEAFLSVPIVLSGIIILIFVLHLLAKLLEGKGSFKETFKAISLCSPILIFWWLPLIKSGLLLWLAYHLIVNFRFYHNYKTPKAMINILIPLFAGLLTMWALRIDLIFR
jgi:hypothetical protein